MQRCGKNAIFGKKNSFILTFKKNLIKVAALYFLLLLKLRKAKLSYFIVFGFFAEILPLSSKNSKMAIFDQNMEISQLTSHIQKSFIKAEEKQMIVSLILQFWS